MKNKAKILGLITAILIVLSAILKINHLAGAGLGLVLSLGLLFPIYFIINILSLFKDSRFNLSTILLFIFFLLFVIGFLFITMHWPLGGLFFKLGFILTSIMLLVIFFLNKQASSEFQISTFLIVILILIISMAYLGSFHGISRNIVEGFEQANENYSVAKDILYQQNDSIAAKFDSSATSLNEVHNMTKELIRYIEDIKQELARMASNNQIISDYSDIIFKENFDVTNHKLIIQGSAKQLKQVLNDYESKLIGLTLDDSKKNQIMLLLNTQDPPAIDGRVETWESSQFEHLPVISAISTLTSIQVNILISESLIIKK